MDSFTRKKGNYVLHQYAYGMLFLVFRPKLSIDPIIPHHAFIKRRFDLSFRLILSNFIKKIENLCEYEDFNAAAKLLKIDVKVTWYEHTCKARSATVQWILVQWTVQ